MTSSGSTPLQYLGRHLPAKFKTDHRRAIDRYIAYFGDCAATGTEPRARRVTSVDEQAISDDGAEGRRNGESDHQRDGSSPLSVRFRRPPAA